MNIFKRVSYSLTHLLREIGTHRSDQGYLGPIKINDKIGGKIDVKSVDEERKKEKGQGCWVWELVFFNIKNFEEKKPVLARGKRKRTRVSGVRASCGFTRREVIAPRPKSSLSNQGFNLFHKYKSELQNVTDMADISV